MHSILSEAVLDHISSSLNADDACKQSATVVIRRSKSHDSDVVVILSSTQPHVSRPADSSRRREVWRGCYDVPHIT